MEPLKRETFLSSAEIAALFGNIQEIYTFQRQFLQNLEEALDLEPDFHKFDHSSQFKVRISSYFTTVLFLVFCFALLKCKFAFLNQLTRERERERIVFFTEIEHHTLLRAFF